MAFWGTKKNQEPISTDHVNMSVEKRNDEALETICCIKVLGAGCKACHDQYTFVQKAVRNMNVDVEVEYITDMEKVMVYGVMSMPAIVVNEKVVSMGSVLKTEEIEKLLRKSGV